ncbi:hypothetical protein MTR_5g081450 [Medicago truncatula]|uniref:Transmembrane protein n=1 Tax=Medicago truncatula TaxID=3880 RepID=G7K235_MEDTR|nr:hypothetical protein MTR_5g081450 [Medicago truncatula]
MEDFLKMFLKFVVLSAATVCALVGNVQGIPPCCHQPGNQFVVLSSHVATLHLVLQSPKT